MSSEQKEKLFLNQKELLDTFLKTGAITKAQYDKSLLGLMKKMGIDENLIEERGYKNGKGTISQKEC